METHCKNNIHQILELQLCKAASEESKERHHLCSILHRLVTGASGGVFQCCLFFWERHYCVLFGYIYTRDHQKELFLIRHITSISYCVSESISLINSISLPTPKQCADFSSSILNNVYTYLTHKKLPETYSFLQNNRHVISDTLVE